jgi:hypothetical protein
LRAAAFVLLGLLAPMLAQSSGAPSEPAAASAFTPDGGRYYGPLLDGKLHGHGRIEWVNGTRYEGAFAAGLFNGRGRFQFASGEVYEGEFQEGLFDGRGKLTTQGGEYEGEFRAGRYEGTGHVKYQDGRSYRGQFSNGRFHGAGRLENANGDAYEGQFDNDALTAGTYTSKDGVRYEGGFRNWMFEGNGTYADGRGNVYEGRFEGGELAGPGTLAGTDGTRYEGEFKHWRYHGKGLLRLANGDVYDGAFAYGQYDGAGTLTYAKPRDGQTELRGTWRYGTLENNAEKQQAQADVETALYGQRRLLDQALAALAPTEPGRINLYLLAVAGDGKQEVFRREVEYVRDQFARDFGTTGRSVALINSRTTVERAPMATVSSIREALQAVAARMDKERDILFLFLTSHGSREHELVLAQRSMNLRGLPAQQLAELLKESGIRWKVVVVSACYSGGFIAPLKDDHTMVLTAARHDRTSFGCSDDADFTFFGRAYFEQALPHSKSFQDAFKRAAALVHERELKEIAPAAKAAKTARKKADAEAPDADAENTHSEPQIHSAAPIDKHLARWWQQMQRERSQKQAANR